MEKSRLVSEIERRMKLLRLNPKKLSALAGLNQTYVRDILKGRSKHPRSDTVIQLAGALGCAVSDLTGEVIQLPMAEAVPKGNGKNNRRILDDKSDDNSTTNMFTIDELDIRASAGDGAISDSDQLGYNSEKIVAAWEIPANIIRGHTSAPASSLRIISVIGDSMTPLFLPGERIMVDIADHLPSPAGIFAIWDGFAQIIKRLELIPYSDPATVRLMSANDAYPVYERRLDEVVINGRVIGKWQWT